MDDDLVDVSLPRSGDAPIAFRGRVVAQHAGKYHNGAPNKRYFDLTLYQTASGKYVLYRHYHTTWRGEMNHDHIFSADTLDAVVAHLRDWRPQNLKGLGYPPRKEYHALQQHLLAALTQLYEERVSALLADAGAVERID